MNIKDLMEVLGILATGVAALLGLRWGWHHLPRHHSKAELTVQRLSEILVALSAVNDGLRRPNPEMGIQTGFLLEIRNAMKDQAERTVVLQSELHGVAIAIMEAAKATGPMLDKLDEIATATSTQAVEMERLTTTLMATTRPSSAEPNLLLHADLQGVITKLDEFQLFVTKQDAKKIVALDAVVLDFGKFAKQQKDFQNTLFNGGSIQTMDDETSAQEEKILALQRRYGLTREAAVERVRGAAVYEPNTGKGMGEKV